MILCFFLNIVYVCFAYTPGDILLIKEKNGYVERIEWGQSKNHSSVSLDMFAGCSPSYNAYCPSNVAEVDQCQHKLAGCGAIAIGQIMAMWQFPVKSKYRTYNWKDIPPVLRDGDTDDCSLLIKDIGDACNMHYESFGIVEIIGSWCSSHNLIDALETFSYNVTSCEKNEWLKYNNIDNWYALIRNEIDCGRPVIIYGEKWFYNKSSLFCDRWLF